MHRPSRTAPAGPRRPAFSRRAAFTLVEVLIVVVILAILAATVLPQFQNASGQAQASAIRQNLSVVRSQIELYRVQHNGELPPATTSTEFVNLMTNATTRAHATGDGATLGPYISGKFPANPAVADAANAVTVDVVAAAPTSDTTVAAGGEGWWYRSDTGEFRAKGSDEYWAY